jgi:hypothetical protein
VQRSGHSIRLNGIFKKKNHHNCVTNLKTTIFFKIAKFHHNWVGSFQICDMVLAVFNKIFDMPGLADVAKEA